MKEGALLNKRYQLLEQLGSGGMASVFRARDLMLDRYVAVKLLLEDYTGNEAFQESFRQEARAAANLTHPNIVTIHDFGVDENGVVYIIMELVPGRDMKTILRQRGRYTVEEGIPLMIQACAGVGYAHRAGIVHCDIKPHNLLISPDQRLKVTDFGIARALATIVPGEKSDVVWGSPQYFSPEQAAGEAPSPASDVYSLGVVMYEMLSGTPPFTAPTSVEMARLHLGAAPIPINEYVPDVPSALEEIIMKVLSKEPSARYRTADQLGRVLLKFGLKRDEPVSPALNLTPEVAEGFSETRQSAPHSQSQTIRFVEPVPEAEPETELEMEYASPPIDWTLVGLGLAALITVGGLIPFWIYIWFLYR